MIYDDNDLYFFLVMSKKYVFNLDLENCKYIFNIMLYKFLYIFKYVS